MISFRFRPSRIERELLMNVGLQDRLSGTPLPGLLEATVINFSSQGACLILPTLTINGNHIFYDTLESSNCNMLIYPDKFTEDEDLPVIAAHSIWMDSCRERSQSAFKIGIVFLENQKSLFRLLKSAGQP